ncbi:MAG: hypothetical protein N2Z65_06570 [Clostridiales bacterium]|nr:hypothetical protein [Clostridiales bacterium]
MNRNNYLSGKIAYIACHLTVAFITISMLVVLFPAGGRIVAVLIGIVYLFGALIPLELEYRRKKDFYASLVDSFERIDQKNLVAEVITRPEFFEGALLYDILKASNKACLEEINKYKNLQLEYREYIEMWVHEIKTPISSSKLIAQNNRSAAIDSMAEELDAIESYVEQALFYARSNAVEKDYIIRKVSLEKPVFAVLKRDSKQLICTGISVSAIDQKCKDTVS